MLGICICFMYAALSFHLKHVGTAALKSALTNIFCITIITNQKPITLEQMLHHCQAVKRGAPNRPLLVGDMPFGSYEFEDIDIALRNAYRMVKEAGMDAVKFEVCDFVS